MLYKKKRVKLPPDMMVGSQVGIVGEGHDTQFITAIERDEEGDVTEVRLSGGCREPLSKIYLCRYGTSGDDLQISYDDRTGWIETSIGECDVCGRQFPDSCVYESDPNKPGSTICLECSEKPFCEATGQMVTRAIKTNSVTLTPINQERLSLLEDCLKFLKEVKHGPSCNVRFSSTAFRAKHWKTDHLSSGKCNCQVPALISRLEARLKADKELVRA